MVGQPSVGLGRQRTPLRSGTRLDGGRHDEVLPLRVARAPPERQPEQVLRKGRDGGRVPVCPDRRARRDGLQPRPWRDPVTQSAQQHGELGALRAVVDVRLVDHHEPPAVALEQLHVLRA